MRKPLNPATVTASLLLAPAILTALAVAALEAGRVRTPRDPLFAAPPPASLAQAILDGDVEAAYVLVRGSQDLNATLDIQLPGAPEGRVSRVTPLTLAVAARDLNDVQMLLSAGADMTLPENRAALCLARARGYSEIVTLLTTAAAGEPPCPAPAPD